eukprot:TRINITY_DN26398_c0_g1_i4.p2 TRINITY_DN26398_c0_g1~~TRINITY_DN26398_c0_g1_i4.p2  ORF type:complete len:108 (+),score=40.24 TRINITY_DN26398_c0_g1_i4:177-500(+)
MQRKRNEDAEVVMKIERAANASAKKIADMEDTMKEAVQFKAKLDTLIEHMREMFEYRQHLEALELKLEGSYGGKFAELDKKIEMLEGLRLPHAMSSEFRQSLLERLR